MPDIFGREPHDYEFVRALQEENRWDGYQRALVAARPGTPPHDFNALGSMQQRAAEDADVLGFLTNNLLAIQTATDEILYTAYRLPMFIAINTAIAEGATSYGIRVMRRVGQASRITAPGFDAPSATVSQSLVTKNLFEYGLDAEWSVGELRGAIFAGIPLATESIEAAVVGTMEKMEAVGLLGDPDGEDDDKRGLLNLRTTGTDKVGYEERSGMDGFAAMTAVDIRNLINGELSAVIETTKETVGRQLNMGMTVYLPGEQYDLLTTRYIGDHAEHTLMASIMRDNPWTHFARTPLSIERVLELTGQGASNSDRMIVALRDMRIAEMGVSIPPRVMRVEPVGRVIRAMVEAKFSSLFVKRPNTIRYTDNI